MDVTVVGGGLAGMVAALRLAERGYTVEIYDEAERLGGKAGATVRPDGRYDDHGYHIFPAWYLNIWELVDELGIRDHFVDCTTMKFLKPTTTPDAFSRFRSIRNPTAFDLLTFWQNLFSGAGSPAQWLLFQYAVLDLASQAMRSKDWLDQLSLTGFVRSRFYDSEAIERGFSDLILKAVSVHAYHLSSMTLRNLVGYWMRYPLPWFRILRGNLQESYIAPIERRLRALGCTIHLSHSLERLEISGARVQSVDLRDRVQDQTLRLEVERLILAIPHERLARMILDPVYTADPQLAQVQFLESRPMAALNVYLKTRIPELAGAHVFLDDSEFDLSFIDVGQLWPGYAATTLNIIASDITPLLSLSPEDAQDQLMADLRRYFPKVALDDANIADIQFQSHIDQPLFINSVGAYHWRPDPGLRRALENLYVAGDYCRSPVDLACMEGAVAAGLRAAETLRQEVGRGHPIPVREPEQPDHRVLAVARTLLWPGARLLNALPGTR